MIELTRLNGNRLVVNCDLIKYAEASPDTTITLVTGEKLVVRESCDELMEHVHSWRVEVLRGAGMHTLAESSAAAAHSAANASGVHRLAGGTGGNDAGR